MVKSTRSNKSSSSSVCNLEISMASSGASNDGAVGHNIPDFSSGHGPQTQLKYGEKYTFPQDLPKFSGEQNAWDKFRCEILFLIRQLFDIDLSSIERPEKLTPKMDSYIYHCLCRAIVIRMH